MTRSTLNGFPHNDKVSPFDLINKIVKPLTEKGGKLYEKRLHIRITHTLRT